MDLLEALDAVIGSGQGTFVSCIAGKLAYFESEDLGERYICHRDQATRTPWSTCAKSRSRGH